MATRRPAKPFLPLPSKHRRAIEGALRYVVEVGEGAEFMGDIDEPTANNAQAALDWLECSTDDAT